MTPLNGFPRRDASSQSRLLEQAQAIAHVGSWSWDLATNDLSWTAEHYRIFGLDPDVFLPTLDNALELVHEDDLPRLRAALDESLRCGTPYSCSVRIRRPCGELRWIDSIGVPSVVGEVLVGLIGTVLDVTDRMLSQSSLRDSEARYKMIVETAREGIWLVDADGITSFANEQLAVMLGRPVEELVGSSLFAFLDDEAREVAAEKFAGLPHGRPCRFDFLFTKPDGTEVWALLSSAPILDDDGAGRGALAMLTDITERKLAEAELIDSRARLAEAQRLALLGYWTLDVRTRKVTCSDGLFAVIGVDPELGVASFERFPLLVHPDDRALAESFLTRVQHDFVPVSDEVRIITPAGDERWLALRAAPVIDAAGIVTEMRGTLQDVTDRKDSEEQLIHLSLHDMLTGLPNRSLFNDRVQRALLRRHNPVVVMIVDLDGFKSINDSLGHSGGDELLVRVGERLSGALRPADTLSRFGGDEFTVLIEGCGPAEARASAQRLLEAFDRPFVIEGRSIHAQASIGIAVATGRPTHIDQLLRDADAAMYSAKCKGGNQCTTFDAAQHTSVIEAMALELDLRAVELGAEMTLHYQPLLDLRDGRLTGFEALVRWNHPTRGPIPPVEFIPIAERTGAIIPIGRWILEEACRQARLWQQHHVKAAGLVMNVNVSARQLADRQFVEDVARVLDVSGLEPSLLTLEITETMLMADEDEVCATLHRLKALGVRISVDDFGTGYSSLGHLDRFPIDELKIDRSFVARLDGEVKDSTVALAVVQLAHTLGLDVVAEGIEHEEQLVQLRAAGCTFGQGYLFSRPLAVDAVELLLETSGQFELPKEPAAVVLVVDDDETVRSTSSRILARAGFDIVEVGTGAAALDVVRTRRVDVVLLDVHLPDMSGLEVCRSLRELEFDLPVAHMTGSFSSVADRVRGLDVGADAYLIKPVAPAELIATIGSLLRKVRRNGTPRIAGVRDAPPPLLRGEVIGGVRSRYPAVN